jgi:hypothetical protein
MLPITAAIPMTGTATFGPYAHKTTGSSTNDAPVPTTPPRMPAGTARKASATTTSINYLVGVGNQRRAKAKLP